MHQAQFLAKYTQKVCRECQNPGAWQQGLSSSKLKQTKNNAMILGVYLIVTLSRIINDIGFITTYGQMCHNPHTGGVLAAWFIKASKCS
jgi:hypothetical protein